MATPRKRTARKSTAAKATAPKPETTEVELRHHWTDAEGESHAPGAKVTVPTDVADQLRNARFALDPDADDATDVEQADTVEHGVATGTVAGEGNTGA